MFSLLLTTNNPQAPQSIKGFMYLPKKLPTHNQKPTLSPSTDAPERSINMNFLKAVKMKTRASFSHKTLNTRKSSPLVVRKPNNNDSFFWKFP
jgi:hypothetical protein